MAAPTSPRVEASSISTTTLRWVYGGANGLGVYRSTDGSTYTLITSPLLVSTITSYEDTGLAAGTKYWYKLSDDAGSTFSSVVTVWTQGCLAPAVGGDGFSLPRFDGDQQQSDQLNNLAQRIEATLQGRLLDPQDCAVCPDDGRIVIDCSDGCRSFVIIADEDINSISIQMCDEGSGNIEFIIPPNISRGICGWPSGFGFTGDECFRAPIVSGADGRTMSVGFASSGGAGGGGGARADASGTGSKRGYGSGLGRGGGGGGAGCTCIPGKVGQLTIKSCNANNSLNCSSTKSLKLIACGGKGPYTWGRTGTINLKGVSGSTPGATAAGTHIEVTPPTNSGSAVAGVAYKEGYFQCDSCVAGACASVAAHLQVLRNCDDTSPGCSTTSPCGTEGPASAATCGCGAGSVGQAGCGASPPTCTDCGTETCGNYQAGTVGGNAHVICDVRTAPMIAAGCSPCGLNEGATVSVTDAVGTVVTIILKA